MNDIVSASKRSQMMAGIRSKNTRPELIVRQCFYTLGLEYRLHARNLPGAPDLLLSCHKIAVFVHGCFWHAHGCHLFKVPSTRSTFWMAKFEENRERDRRNVSALLDEDYRVCVVWECAVKNVGAEAMEHLIGRLEAWVYSDSNYAEF